MLVMIGKGALVLEAVTLVDDDGVPEEGLGEKSLLRNYLMRGQNERFGKRQPSAKI